MHADNDNDGDRLERLITAVEKQTNALTRLIQQLEGNRARKQKAAATRLRRAAPDRVIEATPMVRAAVDRALRRAGHK